MTADTSNPLSSSRRTFLSAASATVASLHTAACIRKPYEKILPYGKRPEDLVPGEPRFFATAMAIGASVQGLLVRSNDGRPTKVDGNPRHPMNRGGTSVFSEASVLELYDPQRGREPRRGNQVVDGQEAEKGLAAVAEALAEENGAGVALLMDELPSPTLRRLVRALKSAHPNVQLYRHDGLGRANARAGAAMVGARGAMSVTGTPHTFAVFDGDPMATEGDPLAFSRRFAEGRAPDAGADANRLYVVESHLSLTGSNADHRLAVRPSQVGDVLAAVSEALRAQGLELPKLSAPSSLVEDPFVRALAEDLMADRGSSLIWVGERQAPEVHALGLVMNQALGNFGSVLSFSVEGEGEPEAESIEALASRCEDGSVEHLVILGSNPVATAPNGLGEALAKAKNSIYLGLHHDETGRAAKLYIPKSHYLETWGDLVASDGTVSIQQPLIAPLYTSISEIELLSRLLGDGSKTGYELVRETHQGHTEGDFDKAWQTWLHDGLVTGHPVDRTVPELAVDALASNWKPTSGPEGMEVVFVRDLTVLDGRYANSPWLQELPDPITKLTWDNAALLSPDTAKALGVQNEDLIAVSRGDETIDLPVWVQPGTADGVIVLPLGHGRRGSGRYAESGFPVEPLRTTSALFATGVKATKGEGTYALACAQLETSMHGRPLALDATRSDFTDEPNFVEKFVTIDPEHIDTLLWKEPPFNREHQWGMTIDLNTCTGCGTCTIACQAENNIPWVGKQDVMMGREMHWIRVDRYFDGQGHNVEMKYQPLTCAQCETAPCENVCPVAATVHSREGLNDMAYNRCIGTRYCANNCPYKVRRFNFFHYTVRNDEEYGMGITMQRNPDVTVRYRGVMEKCSYCVQRITRARIDAKVYRDGIIRDGEVTPACAQACPTDAITFGNLKDETSRVAQKAAEPRNYAMLAELNIRPRTTYLAKLTNPNPKLKEG
ncbi:MAG: 4Fe-4S dicluster domain-containing protein [Myxococcota bacterium]